MKKPELLSPAGSLEKLKVAVKYGADAVYLAGQKFGLRSAADNFTPEELEEGAQFAHEHGAKVYLVLNAFLHDSDLEDLPPFIGRINELKVDGVIASDIGVISMVSKNCRLPIHLSTQASCLNKNSGSFWRRMGVTRLILGREVSIKDASQIKKETGLEVELFIHGSMCMAYSGNCTISNFTQGRDSNRGGCAQSCRFKYKLNFPNGRLVEGISFLSSKDLNGLELLPSFFDHEIDSLKIEGRMRSPLYAALVTKTYREAIDAYQISPEQFTSSLSYWQSELQGIPHREYMTGNLLTPASLDSVFLGDNDRTQKGFAYLGNICSVKEGEYVLVSVRNSFLRAEQIELVPSLGKAILLRPEWLKNAVGESIEKAKVNTIVRLPYVKGAQENQVLRRQGSQT